MSNLQFSICFLLLFGIGTKAQKQHQCISRAITYINHNQSAHLNSYNLRLIAAWLQNQYSFEKKINDSILTYNAPLTDDFFAYNFYNSLLKKNNRLPDEILKNHYEKTEEIEHLFLWATNVNTLPFDDKCKKFIEKETTQSNTNIRQLAHIAIAYQWAKNNISGETEVFFKSKHKIIRSELFSNLKKEKSINDNWLEGLVGVISITEGEALKRKWIKKIQRAQNPDGGWAWEPVANKTSHPHATLLALWILLNNFHNSK